MIFQPAKSLKKQMNLAEIPSGRSKSSCLYPPATGVAAPTRPAPAETGASPQGHALPGGEHTLSRLPFYPFLVSAVWSPPTARIERAPSECARSASKEGDQTASSFLSVRALRARRSVRTPAQCPSCPLQPATLKLIVQTKFSPS